MAHIGGFVAGLVLVKVMSPARGPHWPDRRNRMSENRADSCLPLECRRDSGADAAGHTVGMARSRARRCDRLSPRREPLAKGATGAPPVATGRRTASPSRGAGPAAWTRPAARVRDSRDARHDSAMAPRAGGAEMDVRAAAPGATRRAAGHRGWWCGWRPTIRGGGTRAFRER